MSSGQVRSGLVAVGAVLALTGGLLAPLLLAPAPRPAGPPGLVVPADSRTGPACSHVTARQRYLQVEPWHQLASRPTPTASSTPSNCWPGWTPPERWR